MSEFQSSIAETEERLRNTLSWRKKKGVDYILDWKPPEVLRKYFPGMQEMRFTYRHIKIIDFSYANENEQRIEIELNLNFLI